MEISTITLDSRITGSIYAQKIGKLLMITINGTVNTALSSGSTIIRNVDDITKTQNINSMKNTNETWQLRIAANGTSMTTVTALAVSDTINTTFILRRY